MQQHPLPHLFREWRRRKAEKRRAGEGTYAALLLAFVSFLHIRFWSYMHGLFPLLGYVPSQGGSLWGSAAMELRRPPLTERGIFPGGPCGGRRGCSGAPGPTADP